MKTCLISPGLGCPRASCHASRLIPPEKSGRREVPKTNRMAHLAVQQQSRSIRKAPKKPVVIYVVSPKVIQVKASEFMSLVQQLTWIESSVSSQEELGGGGNHDSGPTTRAPKAGSREEVPFPVLDSVYAQIPQAPSDQLSSWRSFGRANDTCGSAAPERCLLRDEFSYGKTSPSSPVSSSPGEFIDVFCQVSPTAGK